MFIYSLARPKNDINVRRFQKHQFIQSLYRFESIDFMKWTHLKNRVTDKYYTVFEIKKNIFSNLSKNANRWIFWLELKILECQVFVKFNFKFIQADLSKFMLSKQRLTQTGCFYLTYTDLSITIISANIVFFEFYFTIFFLLWQACEQEKDERGSVLCATYRDKAAFAVVAGSAPAALATVLLHDARLVLLPPKLSEKSRLRLRLNAYTWPSSVHCLPVIFFFLNDVFHDM